MRQNIFSCDDPRAFYQAPGSLLGFVSNATGIAGFVRAFFACQLRTDDSDVAPSTLATVVLVLDTPRCSTASADEPGETSARILSANKLGGAHSELPLYRLLGDGRLDFSRQLDDLH